MPWTGGPVLIEDARAPMPKPLRGYSELWRSSILMTGYEHTRALATKQHQLWLCAMTIAYSQSMNSSPLKDFKKSPFNSPMPGLSGQDKCPQCLWDGSTMQSLMVKQRLTYRGGLGTMTDQLRWGLHLREVDQELGERSQFKNPLTGIFTGLLSWLASTECRG